VTVNEISSQVTHAIERNGEHQSDEGKMDHDRVPTVHGPPVNVALQGAAALAEW
jgi:hypothetical protein